MFRQRFIKFLDARSVSATTPSTTLTLAAGEVWHGIVTLRGTISAAIPDILVRIAGTKIAYFGLKTTTLGAGSNQTIESGLFILSGGTTGQTFTIEATNAFAVNSGDLLVYGVVYRN